MKKVIPILAITCLCVYAVLTIWDVTINGFFESPSLNATHFIAGAGKTSLLVRYGLAAISVLSLMIWILLQRELKSGLAKIVIAIVVVTSLMWSTDGLERFADDYREDRFDEIVEQFNSGKSLQSDQVQEILGTPLIIGRQDILIEHRPHAEAWLYSYMPSCGFGWQKRVIYFNTDNVMVDYLSMNEP